MTAGVGRECLTWTVREAADLLGISRNSAYGTARIGEIPTVKIGGRVLVPKEALLRLLGPPQEDQ